MSFDLKDIKGAVVEKKASSPTLRTYGNAKCHGFNDAIDAQASVRLRFNREKLLLKTVEIFKLGIDEFQKGYITQEHFCGVLADAIIAAELQIIEVEL